MQDLHVNTIIAKFFVGQNIVTSQKQTHDLRFFGGATGVVGKKAYGEWSTSEVLHTLLSDHYSSLVALPKLYIGIVFVNFLVFVIICS